MEFIILTLNLNKSQENNNNRTDGTNVAQELKIL